MRGWGVISAALVLGAGCSAEEDSVGALAGQCQSCHPEHAQAHEASRHARAGEGEVFIALRERTAQTMGAQSASFCDGCHRPAVGSGQGLSCISCHAAHGNLGTRNGQLVHDLSGPVRGPLPEGSQAPHQTVSSGFLRAPDLCGTCHQVEGPAGFDERPFTHYQEGPAAQDGLRCQDCHMGPAPGDPTVPRRMAQIARVPGLDLPLRPLTEHRPIGPDDPEPERLLSQGLSLLIVEVTPQAVTVELNNTFGGHHLPDGASFLRALWLEVTDDGRPLGSRPLGAQQLRDGVEVTLPTEADEVRSRGLVPGQPLLARFPRTQPIGALRACVRFMRYRPEVLQALGVAPEQLEGPGNVPVDVLCVTD